MTEQPDRTNAPPVLALMGSPRRGGNTDLLLGEFLDGADEEGVDTEVVAVAELDISPCRERYTCLDTGRCDLEDDMTPLYDRLIQAQVVVVATPIFFYGPTAQIKAVMDRCQALWCRKYHLKRPLDRTRGQGYLISVAATNGRRLFDGLLLTIRYFFNVLDLKLDGQLLVRGADLAGDVLKQPEALTQARELGRAAAAFVRASQGL
jgi:multimeric flavodoxin WrbA